MAKNITSGQQLRDKMLSGINKLADTVCITLGPLGRNVIVERKWGTPLVLHDGVSVAKEIFLSDPDEDVAVQLVKEAAEKTNDRAGDGTTTSTLLVQQIVRRSFDLINKGSNPMVLKKGINQAVARVVEQLAKIAKPVQTSEEIAQVATISSADATIGVLIAEAMEKVGREGAILVEDGTSITTEVEYKEGMEIDKGLVSSYLLLPDQSEVEIDEPYILLTDQILSSARDMIDFLIKFREETDQRELVIIANRVESEALGAIVVNHLKGTIRAVVTQAPGIADRQKDILEDIAVLTGATVVSRELGTTLDNVTMAQLGRADKVRADMNKIIIVGGRGEKLKITQRVDRIKQSISETQSLFDGEKLRERLARLGTGIAIIKVGASTEQVLKEKKLRVEDAVGATRSAVEEGIIPGGGLALYNIAFELGKIGWSDSEEEFDGYNLVIDALQEPVRKILSNAGMDVEQALLSIRAGKDSEYGVNILTGEYGNLFQMGIIDPKKVTRLALENAAEVAGLVITAQASLTDIPEKLEHAPSQ